MSKVVLLANVGNSDVKLEDETRLPKQPDEYRRSARKLGEEIRDKFETYVDSIQLPLLEPTLEWITKDATCNIKDIVVFIFASDQDKKVTREEEWRNDTAPYAEVIQLYLNQKQQMPKKQVKIIPISGNPANYPNALEFHQKTLTDIKNRLPADARVYMEVSGGTPAMTAMLMLMGVETFGQDVITLYMDRGSKSPKRLGVSEALFARKTKQTLRDQMNLYAYGAARKTVIQDGRLLTADENRRNLISKLLGYADRRLAFDYKRARDELEGSKVVGELQAQLDYWQRELAEPKASHHLAELIHSAQIKLFQGEYADFTQRLFRFQEAILRCMAEQMGIIIIDNYLSDTWRSEKPELDNYLKSYRRRENGIILSEGSKAIETKGRSLNRYSLGAIVDYFIQQSDWSHWSEPTEKIFRLSLVADLRNKGIAGHGFEGISQEDIENVYTHNCDQLINHLKEIYEAVFEKAIRDNPYDTINALILDLIEGRR
ncbi:MAG: hypothetical protein MUF87_16725 [Anaerolineae bacterium]|nr:hypothetical protein [Anaerolineae bacterium]